jgi:type IV pilus assembly protein PilC
LNYAGYQLINLRLLAAFPTLEKISLRLFPLRPANIIIFYRQMALLIESGLNMVTALELLEEQTSQRAFKRVLHEIIADVRGGTQLSTSMGKHPDIFLPIHCQSLKVGEQTGGLEAIFRQVADHMEKLSNSKKSIKSAMIYPVIALIVAIGVIAIMITFVFPAFSSLYASMGAELPFLTQLTLDMGNNLSKYGLYILAVIIAAAIAAFAYTKTASGKYNLDKMSLTLPLVGRVIHLNELSRISRNISILFRAGLPLTEILPLVIQSSNNRVVAEALREVRDEMLGGAGLSRPMGKHPLFLPMMVQMVKVGEETGNLDDTLLSVAQSYEDEAEDKTKSLVSMIQPVMTIVIGLVVGLMAITLVSSMYSMYGQGI